MTRRKGQDSQDLFEQEAERTAAQVTAAAGPGEITADSPGDPRAAISARMGYDFRNVRFHTGADAWDAAARLDADAFAVGGDVYFGAGQYAPGSREGRRLIAHELAHVAQQGAAPPLLASSPTLRAAEPGTVQRDIAQDKLASTPVETIMADEKWFENGVKNVAYHTGELARLQYNDGSEIRVGLVPEWIEAPFEAVDFKTPSHVHIPIVPPAADKAGSLGTGSIRFIPLGAELTSFPAGTTFADVSKSDEVTRTIRFTHHKNGRIVPTEVNTLSAPRLCQALVTAEAEFIKRSKAVSEATVDALEKIEIVVTLGSIAGGIVAGGRAVGGRVMAPRAGAAVGAAARATARAEGVLTKLFRGLLKSGRTANATVEGVGFGGVQATVRGTELVVARTTIVNAARVPAQGRLIHAAFERAAIATAREVGAKTARVALHTVQNAKWAAYLEAGGYTFELIRNGTVFSRVLTKIWVL